MEDNKGNKAMEMIQEVIQKMGAGFPCCVKGCPNLGLEDDKGKCVCAMHLGHLEETKRKGVDMN